jgi:tRNA(fMet)-specific endonuclease VapC
VLLIAGLDLLDFDDKVAQTAGRVRAALKKAGTPIGAYDPADRWSGTSARPDVVTASTSEFSRVTGLSWEDWTT